MDITSPLTSSALDYDSEDTVEPSSDYKRRSNRFRQARYSQPSVRNSQQRQVNKLKARARSSKQSTSQYATNGRSSPPNLRKRNSRTIGQTTSVLRKGQPSGAHDSSQSIHGDTAPSAKGTSQTVTKPAGVTTPPSLGTASSTPGDFSPVWSSRPSEEMSSDGEYSFGPRQPSLNWQLTDPVARGLRDEIARVKLERQRMVDKVNEIDRQLEALGENPKAGPRDEIKSGKSKRSC